MSERSRVPSGTSLPSGLSRRSATYWSIRASENPLLRRWVNKAERRPLGLCCALALRLRNECRSSKPFESSPAQRHRAERPHYLQSVRLAPVVLDDLGVSLPVD